MAATLDTVRKTLLESVEFQKELQELFDSPPLYQSFLFHPIPGVGIETSEFKDRQGNRVKVVFMENTQDVYELDFQVNGNSYKADQVQYSVKEYGELLQTVARCASQFLEEFSPYGLIFRGADDFMSVARNPKKKGQKNRIYEYFISQMKKNPNYIIGKYPDGIGLQKIQQ